MIPCSARPLPFHSSSIPNYLTVENASSLPPLTVGQKFKLAAEETFDPVEFGFVGLAAAVNQATGADPTYGPGLKGYGRRYALEFGDNTVENAMVDALFPAALRQDPRYYQLGKGGFSTGQGTLPRGPWSHARTRETPSSTSLKSSARQRPQASPVATIPPPERLEALSVFGVQKLAGMSSASR